MPSSIIVPADAAVSANLFGHLAADYCTRWQRRAWLRRWRPPLKRGAFLIHVAVATLRGGSFQRRFAIVRFHRWGLKAAARKLTGKGGGMSGGAQGSLFTLSIDLELDLHQQTEERRDRLDGIRTELLSLLQQHQLKATWAVADPAISAATDAILASNRDHEIAVLADRSWFGAGAGRVRLRRELARRFERARRSGIDVSTLVLRNVDEVTEVDLLLEQGISAIRGPARPIGEPGPVARTSSRADIWHLPSAWQAPTQSAWWLPANWFVKRRIRQAMRQRLPIHLAIDSPRLVEEDATALANLSELVAWLAAQCAAGQLENATLGDVGRQFVEQHVATPSRSILRPAA